MAAPVTRNGRASLYVRCLVPRPLRGLIGRSEILKSLDTKNFFIGKLRAGLVKGRAALHLCGSTKAAVIKYIYLKDAKGIMEMIQMDVSEIHPRSATIDNIHTPDRMIFDLDPSEVKKVALESENDSKRRTRKFREMHGQGPAYHGVIGAKNNLKSAHQFSMQSVLKPAHQRLPKLEIAG